MTRTAFLQQISLLSAGALIAPITSWAKSRPDKKNTG
jgi:hypothetical protein